MSTKNDRRREVREANERARERSKTLREARTAKQTQRWVGFMLDLDRRPR